MTGNAPYENERQASAAARAVIPPEPGWSILSQEQRYEFLRAVLAECGVETSEFEDRTAWWFANWEDYTVAIIARWVRAAYEVGKAAGPGEAVTEWGVSFGTAESIPRGPVQRYRDEADARQAKRDVEALDPSHRGRVVSRQVWTEPWNEVPDA